MNFTLPDCPECHRKWSVREEDHPVYWCAECDFTFRNEEPKAWGAH